ncbi:MAG: hypothetical protein COY80_00630 [Candidatus Pacebacteria bacterium CG_4_10_14_0_8_um_filter_42_14]|nr:MAG: hypothetical protein COY80_00630 [Candidatus Pacebacteria bacterium CG_4_10_14_0_8_um_filter_42_14]
MATTTKHIILEKLRNKLAIAGRLKELSHLYSQKYTFLTDENSPSFWDKRFHEFPIEHPMARMRERFVAEHVSKTQKLLHLGVGIGTLEQLLFPEMAPENYLGTDITADTLKAIQKKFPNYSFRKASLYALPFADSSYEQIALLEVLEHIQPHFTFVVLSEIHRVLRKNGTFIVSIPVNEKLEYVLPHNPNSHQRLYTKELLTSELGIIGFKVMHVEPFYAFGTHYKIKQILSNTFHIRKPNNLVFVCKKL